MILLAFSHNSSVFLIFKGPTSSMETGDTVLMSTVFNITQNSKTFLYHSTSMAEQ